MSLHAAQNLQGDLLPLNKLPAFCMCATVQCKFQAPTFFKQSVERLIETEERLTEEVTHLREGFSGEPVFVHIGLHILIVILHICLCF